MLQDKQGINGRGLGQLVAARDAIWEKQLAPNFTRKNWGTIRNMNKPASGMILETNIMESKYYHIKFYIFINSNLSLSETSIQQKIIIIFSTKVLRMREKKKKIQWETKDEIKQQGEGMCGREIVMEVKMDRYPIIQSLKEDSL